MFCRKPSFVASPWDSPSRLSRASAFCSFIVQYPFFLLQSSSQARDVLIELLAGRTALPLLQGYLVGPAQVHGFDLAQISHHTGSIADQGHLEVQDERANVHVARSDHGDVIVDGDVLG